MLFLMMASFINFALCRKFWAYEKSPKVGINLIQNTSDSEAMSNNNIKHEQVS